MATRSTAVTAALAAGAALVATGITYASAASEPANTAPIAQQAAPIPAPAAAPAPEAALEGSGGNNGRGDNGRDNGRGDDDNDRGYEGKGNEGGHGGGGGGREHEHKRFHIGRIHINERDYPAIPDGCITVVSGLGSKSLNVRNDSHRTVEVFSGATCDNGAPIAVVGPWSQSDGLFPRHVRGGVKVKHGVVGSFRVIKRHHHGDKGDDFDRD
ncbi:hypothetical protein AB0L85_17095 [Streptomyces sp. NPDC052051]|uniref:hypothetical protein n=1 Tax=Streptomyces sp. NPDC052051 TaxID=3154649 RepID=UPI003416129E